MITKHNARATRNHTCGKCGSEGVYLAHDTNIATGERCRGKGSCGGHGRKIYIDRTPETTAIPQGGEVPERFRHAAHCPGRVGNGGTDTTDRAPEVTDDGTEDTDDTGAAVVPAGGHAVASLDLTDVNLASMIDIAVREAVRASRREEAAAGASRLDSRPHRDFEAVMIMMRAGLNVWLTGPAGTGKSTLAKQCATALGLEYHSISMTAGTTRTAFEGFMNAQGEYVATAWYNAMKYGHVFGIDEIDAGHPNALGIVNEGAANRAMDFPNGERVIAHPNFRVVATANTWGNGPDAKHVGRLKIDKATTNRFVFRFVDYDRDVERAMCLGTGLDTATVDRVLSLVWRYRDVILADELEHVMSPRNSHAMCALLYGGMSWDEAAEAAVYGGMSSQDRQKLARA